LSRRCASEKLQESRDSGSTARPARFEPDEPATLIWYIGTKDGAEPGVEEKPQGKKDGKPECYNCHKIGHHARDCRGPKVRPQRQINAVVRTANESPTDKTHNTARTPTHGRGGYNNVQGPWLEKPDPIGRPQDTRKPFKWNSKLGRNQWVTDDYDRLEEMAQTGWPMTYMEKREFKELNEEVIRPTMEINVLERQTPAGERQEIAN